MISLLLGLGIASPPAAADAYAELVRKGDERHAAFDLIGALAACERARVLDGGRLEALTCLAHMHNDIGVVGDRADAEPHYLKGIQLATEAQRRFPDSAVAHFWAAASHGNLALLKGGRQKVRLARHFEGDAKRAISLDPDFAAPYVGLGIYYREVAELSWFLRQFARLFAGSFPGGTREDSLRMLERAVELTPEDVFARHQLGLTLESLGRKDDAVREYERALALPNKEPRDEKEKAEARERLAKLRRRR